MYDEVADGPPDVLLVLVSRFRLIASTLRSGNLAAVPNKEPKIKHQHCTLENIFVQCKSCKCKQSPFETSHARNAFPQARFSFSGLHRHNEEVEMCKSH